MMLSMSDRSQPDRIKTYHKDAMSAASGADAYLNR